jgi:hypothetical protein
MAENLVAQNEMFFSAFEPKMQNRFIMELEGVPAYVIKGVTRPTLRQDAKPINHINVQRYVKGRTVWQPITLTLHDPIVPSAAQAVMEWVRLHHESVTGRDGYADFYKKDLTFNVLGPVGDKVEEWVIKGAQIVEANFGDMNWDNDDPANITLQIQPDYCILNY